MAQILQIGAADIEQALSEVTRQYLVGNLERPQILRHIAHGNLEIGVTRYGPKGGIEAPHTHRHAFE
jgi:8-oxo-dGTP diphosphatase